jgi:hypothetical protein
VPSVSHGTPSTLTVYANVSRCTTTSAGPDAAVHTAGVRSCCGATVAPHGSTGGVPWGVSGGVVMGLPRGSPAAVRDPEEAWCGGPPIAAIICRTACIWTPLCTA